MKNIITYKLFEKYYSASPELKDKIDKIVSELLLKYKGGKEFFDALDDKIKDISLNKKIINELVKGKSNSHIISSGEFGDLLYKLWKKGEFKCKSMVVVNGKILTGDLPVYNWYPKEEVLENKEYVFIDDSYFSGKTANKINEFLKKKNSKIKYVQVVYDGSKKKNKGVKSFYRYYDNVLTESKDYDIEKAKITLDYLTEYLQDMGLFVEITEEPFGFFKGDLFLRITDENKILCKNYPKDDLDWLMDKEPINKFIGMLEDKLFLERSEKQINEKDYNIYGGGLGVTFCFTESGIKKIY